MKRAGFTLFETLMAVTMMALLATLVVTAAQSNGGQSLESVARIVAADLRLARAQAVQYNTDWTVVFDLDGNGYELLHTGTGDPPPLVNPLHPDRETYRVEVGELGCEPGENNGVRLLLVRVGDSPDPPADITFGPLGGTGPTRTEDTVVVLVDQTSPQIQAVRLTVSWVTGHVRISELLQVGQTTGPEALDEAETELIVEEFQRRRAETLPEGDALEILETP